MSDNSKKQTYFGMMRHAQTEWNLEKRIQGHLDSPLTAAGERKAATWGERLHSEQWDRVIVSDLGRAVATGEWANRTLGLPLHKDPLLREQNWGLWSGRKVTDLLREMPDFSERFGSLGWGFCPPEGENRETVRRRGEQALCAAAERWAGERILVVTHAGMIRCLVNGLMGRAFLPSEPAILWSGHLHRLVHDEAGLRVAQLNAIDLDGRRGSAQPAGEADFITTDAG